MTGNVGALGAARLQDENRGMVAGQAQEQVGVKNLAFVARALVRVQTRERAPVRRARMCKGISAVPMRNASRPIQRAAARCSECRHYRAELWMHAAAVIALIVVLTNRFPVGCNLVSNRLPDAQLS